MVTGAVAVIPARWGSSRLPGKPLADLGGLPVVGWVYRRVRQVQAFDRVIVATDDSRIGQAVEALGGEWMLTSPACANGTERVREAVRHIDCRWVVNVQGDEPFVETAWVERLLQCLKESDAPMATLMTSMKREEENNPNRVKVAPSCQGHALYFSRFPVPYPRQGEGQLWRHLGLYGYRRDFLDTYAALPPSPLSEAESLEQLRALEWGYRIALAAVDVTLDAPGIDTADDLEQARSLVSRLGLRP